MGTFQGHALPGSFFIVFALWWLSQIPRRYLLCQRLKVPYFNTATYPFPLNCCAKLPIEGIVKLLVTSIGMSAELYASTDYGRAGKIVSIGDIQHVTMYSFFFLSGLVDVLRNRNFAFAPPGLEYITAALAFGTEGLLFSRHLYGRTPLDVALHTLLLYVVVGIVIVILLEYKYQDCLMLVLARTVLTLAQGTWFIQVGIILYPPTPFFHSWDEHDHGNIMKASMYFTWHIGGCSVFVLACFAVLYRTYDGCLRTNELKIEEIPWMMPRKKQHGEDSSCTEEDPEVNLTNWSSGQGSYKMEESHSEDETIFDNSDARSPLLTS